MSFGTDWQQKGWFLPFWQVFGFWRFKKNLRTNWDKKNLPASSEYSINEVLMRYISTYEVTFFFVWFVLKAQRSPLASPEVFLKWNKHSRKNGQICVVIARKCVVCGWKPKDLLPSFSFNCPCTNYSSQERRNKRSRKRERWHFVESGQHLMFPFSLQLKSAGTKHSQMEVVSYLAG